MLKDKTLGVRAWFGSGEPWIWMNAGAVAISIAAVVGVVGLIAVRGFAHFWPADVALIDYVDSLGERRMALGEIIESETLPAYQYLEATGKTAEDLAPGQITVERWLVKTGNRRIAPPDFRWVVAHAVTSVTYPEDAVVLERVEWGNAYGYLRAVYEDGKVSSEGTAAWADLAGRIARVAGLREVLRGLERSDLNRINYELNRQRLQRRAIDLRGATDDPATQATLAAIEAAEAALRSEYDEVEQRLRAYQAELRRDSLLLELADGTTETISLAEVVKAWQPNALGVGGKTAHYFQALGAFLTEDPREANTEGGIFPAIFGTVMMVLLMSVLVTPFGVIAAVYLREYARQGPLVRLIRIAVNNLAGVPSIVYGVFGLGFFVYFLGGSLDALFFPEALPSPTFGTPGLLWASLTLALLTLPVVVVSTEEGLTRIPRSLREGSLALGATKAETLFKVILPVASPSILTGVILAVARAAGEVAPLMLVGVVKLAPTLPIDGNFPYVHLERKFMHLGFHIYDVGFQSPNVEAARPLVYATALLLVIIILVLNLTAILLRGRLENRYRGVET
ncbi:MAG: phosphate ABC transporter permease PstA [Pseudomonadales bacterium]|nr:phosphate ABC transporter permease PstA [Pseudomonadales bacterium]